MESFQLETQNNNTGFNKNKKKIKIGYIIKPTNTNQCYNKNASSVRWQTSASNKYSPHMKKKKNQVET